MVAHEDVANGQLWLDYAAEWIPGETLARYGISGVMRYLGASHLTSNWRKDMEEAEYRDLKASGREVLATYEIDTGDFTGAYNGGIRAARNILRDGGEWYEGFYCLTIDRHFSAGERALAVQYTLGWLSIIPVELTAGYGFGEAIDVFKQCGITLLWQCGNWADVRPGVRWYQRNDSVDAEAVIYINGVKCDINDDLMGDDVALTPQQVAALAKVDEIHDKVCANYTATDGRPLPLDTPDDLRGMVMSLLGYANQNAGAVQAMRDALETGGVEFDYDRFIAKLQEKGLVTQAGLDQSLVSLAHNLTVTVGLKGSENPGGGQ
jgi:hypothetical protein